MSTNKAPKAAKTNAVARVEKATKGLALGPKAAKGKAAAPAKAPRAKRMAYAGKAIKVLQKECPYREGTKRAKSFNALAKAKTTDQYLAAGGKAKYLGRWVAAGIIALA